MGRHHDGSATRSPGTRRDQLMAEPTPPLPPAPPAPISIDEFKKITLKIGVIVSAEDHPNADRLLVLKVDIGEGAPRQLVAGIKGAYQAADVVGKRVIVVANLQPAMLRGVESQGMVLAATDASGLSLLSPERPISPGTPVK